MGQQDGTAALCDYESPLSRWLSQIEESELRLLVRDLLRAMGYSQVAITHGSLEFGRDLIFAETDRIGRHIWRGVQVKAQPMSGSLDDRGLRTLINQCEAALDTPVVTSTGETVKLSEIWIVNSHQLSEHAKHSIAGKLKQSNSVEIIDGPVLHDLVQKYMPQLLTDRSTPLESYMRNLRQFCDTADDYLTARFGARIPLSRCYIPPTLTLSASIPQQLRLAAAASVASGLSALATTVDQYRALAANRFLPGRRLKSATELIERLDRFVDACSDTTADIEGEVPRLRSAVQHLAGLIEPTCTEQGAAASGGLSGNVTPAALEARAGAFLRTREMQRKFVVLSAMSTPKDQLGARQRHGAGSSKISRELAANEARAALAAYEQCLINITEAFSCSRVIPEPYFEVAECVVDHLFPRDGQSDDAKPTAAQSACHELSEALERIVMVLKMNYAELAATLTVFERQPPVLEEAEISTAVALSQLTDVLDTLYAFSPEQLIQLTVTNPEALVKRVDKLALIADLGFGKSTVLKRLAYNVISQDSSLNSTVPAFVVLAAVGSQLRVSAQAQLMEAAKHSFSGLERRSPDEMLWLLDGFDEMQSHVAARHVTEWMMATGADAPKRVWITSRPSAMTAYIPGLRKARLAPFEAEQIDQYIERFPWTSASRRDSLKATLKDAPELAELARMPLLLTLLALLSDSENDVVLPRRREGIYERILSLFMGDWDRAKGINRQYVIRNQPDRIMMLGRAALDLYGRRQRTFSRQDFVSSYAADIASVVAEPNEVAATALDELVRDSLLVEQPGERFAFFHFSIQEYLAATALAAQVTQQQVWTAITEYSRDGWWEEVLVFYAGIKRDVGPLVTDMHRHFSMLTKANHIRLRRLLERWLMVADFTDPSSLRPGRTVINTLVSIDPKFADFDYDKYLGR